MYEKFSRCELCGERIDLRSEGWREGDTGDICAGCVATADENVIVRKITQRQIDAAGDFVAAVQAANVPLPPHDELRWDGDDIEAVRGGVTVATIEVVPAEVSAAAASMGRRGGRSRSEAKQAASRTNGKLGGRPRKTI